MRARRPRSIATVELVRQASEVDFADETSIRERYYKEVEALLEHNIRVSGLRGVRDHLPPDEAEVRLQKRHAIINVWRPVGSPVLTRPLDVRRTEHRPWRPHLERPGLSRQGRRDVRVRND